jgi:hypothetical protein
MIGREVCSSGLTSKVEKIDALNSLHLEKLYTNRFTILKLAIGFVIQTQNILS